MKTLKLLPAAALALLSLSSMAATTWNTTSFSTTSSSAALTTGGVTATIYAYSSAPGNSSMSSATLTTIGTTPSGLGAQAGSNDAKGLDNTSGIDALLLHFTAGSAESAQFISSFSVAKSSTSTGGCSGSSSSNNCGSDSDASLFRWTGSGSPTTTPSTSLTTGSLNAGWALVGNYGNAASLGASTTNTLTSSWWMISAYNSAWGSSSSNGGSLSNGDDCVDVLSFVTGTPTTTPPARTPEPGTAALAAVALLGALALRRKA